MEKTMLAPSGGKVSKLVRRCAEGIEYWLDEKLFTEEQITKITRAAATHPIPSSLFEFAAQTFPGVTSKRVEPEPSEEIGKVEADKIVRARAKSVERLAGRKLFTEEQLAEVAQEIQAAATDMEGALLHQGVRIPPIHGEFVARRFARIIDKLEGIVGGAGKPETSEGEDHLNFTKSRDMLEAAAIRQDRLNRTVKHLMDPLGTSDKPVYKNIIEAIRTIQHAAWENSKAHGWNEAVDNPASALMMITREVSELAEEERDASSGESTKIPGFSKKEEEAADIAIRLLSYCGARNMRLGEAICAKHEFNKTRPYRHGNKLF